LFSEVVDHVDCCGYGEEEEDGYDDVCFEDHFVVVVDVDDGGSVSGVGCIENKEEEGDESGVDHEAEHTGEFEEGVESCFSLC